MLRGVDDVNVHQFITMLPKMHMPGTINRAQRKLKWEKIRALSADRMVMVVVVEEEAWIGS